jgi:hypothetical protein
MRVALAGAMAHVNKKLTNVRFLLTWAGLASNRRKHRPEGRQKAENPA